MKQELMRANGSVQHIEGIPADIKELYKTVWEMSMKDIIDMARHRGYFMRSITVTELIYGRGDYGKINLYALLCLEIWLKDRDVLLKNEISRRCD